MATSKIQWRLMDNGGRRSGMDRRYFSYSSHIPERRCSTDRRTHEDRRSGSNIWPFEPKLNGARNERREVADKRSMWN